MSVQELLDTAVEGDAIPGLVAITATPEGVGEITAAGLPDDTIFRYASMTKLITTVAVMQLVERGELALEQEVASVLPEFADLQVLDSFEGNEPVLRAPASAATVGQLLNHTAGCSYFFSNERLHRYNEITGGPHILTGLRASVTAPLIADPGTIWEYGCNTDWAGLLVEEISGSDLETYLRQNVSDPLGLESVTFAPSDEQRDRMMPIHHRQPDGSAAPGELELPSPPEFWPGGHGLHGTAADYGRFMAAILNGGAEILQPASVDRMFANTLGDIALPELIRSADPIFSNDIPSLPVPQGWGLGVHLTLEDLPGMRRAGTGDWAGLFNSYYWIDRASGVAGAIFTQLLPFFDERVVEAAIGFEQAVYTEVGAPAG
ncbi:MAG: beta-lactamase family protein [Thermoleophilaceae bacterium]|nr:beta-lactamase family protein [Thermoleophilaceae bacterium]